jgi:protein-tyrosine phosphatase
MEKIRVLFVCMGNICRSPTAEGVFNKLIEEQGVTDQFEIDSAGTHAYHEGEAPDLRAQKAAQARDILLTHIKARKVINGDFEDYDYILAMDQDNFSVLTEACPEEHKHKIKYFLDYAPHLDTREVPDPYYGGRFGFESVLDLTEAAAEGFITALKQKREIQ